MQNQTNRRTGLGFSGFGHFFAVIFTLGIYQIYWSYMIGVRLEVQGGVNRGLWHFVLTVIGFGFIAALMIQHEANKLAVATLPAGGQVLPAGNTNTLNNRGTNFSN